jgi:hypothetical protein
MNRSPELDFIIQCLDHRLRPDRPLPQRPTALNLDRFRALAIEHKVVGPLLQLGKQYPGLWEPDLDERLMRFRHAALAHSERGRVQVTRALSALRQAGIPVIVLRGWAYIPIVYGGDCGQRTCGDVDLLVLPGDVGRTDDILLRLGYRRPVTEMWPGYCRRYYGAFHYKLNCQSGPQDGVFSVDLHQTHLDRPFRGMALNQVFQRARPLQVVGVEVHGLQPEDDLLCACGHLALHHRYEESLHRYYEMAFVIRQAGPSFDWSTVVARARDWRLILPLQRVGARLEELWPGILPAKATRTIAALRPSVVERLVHDEWVRQPGNPTVKLALALLVKAGPGNRLGFILETAFPCPAYLLERYGPAPGGLWPLWYFWRVATVVQGLARYWTGARDAAGRTYRTRIHEKRKSDYERNEAPAEDRSAG